MSDKLNVSPTRSELLEVKRKIALAKKGHSLLKRKQDVLIGEFFKRISDYKKQKGGVTEQVKASYRSLSLDIAYAGIFLSRSAAYAVKPHYDISYARENIMGLRLPAISAVRKDMDLNHVYDNSPQLAKATERFHDVFERLIALTSMKMTIRSLAEEIKKIKRRVNSLENIQIPRLERTKAYISFVLEEQERESFIRLKSIKKRLESGV